MFGTWHSLTFAIDFKTYIICVAVKITIDINSLFRLNDYYETND